MKIRITWPDGHEDICADYDSPEALVAGMWGSTPIPEGVSFEQVLEEGSPEEEDEGKRQLEAAINALSASVSSPEGVSSSSDAPTASEQPPEAPTDPVPQPELPLDPA